MRSTTMILAALLIGTAASAQAPAAAPAASVADQVKAGATIYDPAGTEAATIESVANGLVVVSTGTNKVTLPIASFAPGAKGPVVSVTRAQLDAAAVQGKAQADAALATALVAGAPVKGSGGNAIGTVKTVATPNVVLSTAKGDVAVPKAAFSAGPGGLVVAMTASEFDAATAAAQPK